MAKSFRPYDPEQQPLLPPSLEDWLPEDHLARFVDELIGKLDLRAIHARYEEERGYPPYHPAMMTKILLFEYAVGVYSGRRLAKAIETDVAFRFLAAQNLPGHRTIIDSAVITGSHSASSSPKCSMRAAQRVWWSWVRSR